MHVSRNAFLVLEFIPGFYKRLFVKSKDVQVFSEILKILKNTTSYKNFTRNMEMMVSV